jgi:hypothetical protein
MKILLHVLLVAVLGCFTIGCKQEYGTTVEQGEPSEYEVEHDAGGGGGDGAGGEEGSDTSAP